MPGEERRESLPLIALRAGQGLHRWKERKVSIRHESSTCRVLTMQCFCWAYLWEDRGQEEKNCGCKTLVRPNFGGPQV
jgi:hypothetical protein